MAAKLRCIGIRRKILLGVKGRFTCTHVVPAVVLGFCYILESSGEFLKSQCPAYTQYQEADAFTSPEALRIPLFRVFMEVPLLKQD